MTWIKTIPYEQAEGKLKKIYDRVKGPDNNVDNILLSHSLRPHSLEGHMVLYKNVIHNSNNTVDKWLLEALGVYVSILNACPYCIEHHYIGMQRLVADDERSLLIRKAFEEENIELAFDEKHRPLFTYARQLVKEPQNMNSSYFEVMKNAGWDDGEVLEVNQVVSYFCYANRTVLGLGVTTDGDIVGLSPNNSDDSNNWSHA